MISSNGSLRLPFRHCVMQRDWTMRTRETWASPSLEIRSILVEFYVSSQFFLRITRIRLYPYSPTGKFSGNVIYVSKSGCFM